MAKTLLGKTKVKSLLDPVSVTSDGATGNYVDYNGWNSALIIVQGGLVATGDSADTLAFQIHRIDDIAAASAAASDHVDITAGIATLGPAADTDTQLDFELLWLDFEPHALDNGCLNVTATASEGGAIAGSAAIQFYGKNGPLSDTDHGVTIVVPASS
jgi:hypothetical protein